MDELDNSQKLKLNSISCLRILEDKHGAFRQIVNAEGEITAPYIGVIKAEGLTCRELALKIKPELAKLEKDYLVNFRVTPPVEKGFFINATVLVALDGSEKPVVRCACPKEMDFVVAFGSVAKQGKFDLASIPEHKLSSLLKLAGGLTANEGIPKIKVVRKTSQGNKTIVVDGKALLNKSPETDLVLKASDVVIVE